MLKKDRESTELAWQAYRYIVEEMTPTEQRAFEDRLDGDQPAREAVAAMVHLSSHVQALPPKSFQSRSRLVRLVQPAAWMALGAAACLTVMLGFQSVTHRGREGFSPHDQQVALAWTPGEGDTNETDTSTSNAAVTAVEVAADEDLETPSWLMAAVAPQESLPREANSTETE